MAAMTEPALVHAALPPGTPAPDFRLNTTSWDEWVSLSDYRGRHVILVFYPADWSPDCGDQLTLYNEILPEFEHLGATVLGISVENVFSHRAFSDSRHFQFPILADFEPKGEVARRYGVYRDDCGMNHRALFIVDRNGIIAWNHVAPWHIVPGADGILTALEAMAEGRQPEWDGGR